MVKLLCELNSVLQLLVREWLLQNFVMYTSICQSRVLVTLSPKKSPINRTEIQAGPKQGHLAATNREEIAAGLPTLYEVVPKITRKLLHEGCEHKTNFIFLNCFTCLRIQIQEVKERNLLNL